ncbi:Ubiquitin system component Cue [Penicillium robsamsonii]|uniref:Ubiquitin system component Cue n=1 Tax=Penicillium robsamsonii TaxID=1792511 RepID=UPI002546B8F7|nr:Ubiquitin system component Cue [Penicillium robsamsonii]KAJ5827701.1 Ubiquitin system component Cue [Penicillium robsamsonii]
MSEEDKMNTPKPLAVLNSPTSPRPESPTTARPMDFDDEPQENGVATSSPVAAQPVAQPAAAEAAPPKPPRPLNPREQSENTLREAFPSIEPSVVRAVLTASNWNVERAFNALLGMTDPKAQEEMTPPPKPPRPTQQSTAAQRQLEADEMYARQLSEHYNATGRRAPPPNWESDPRYQRPRGSEESEEREYSFFDDDLPVIRENLRKGFLDTQSKVNSWVTNLKKRIDGDDLDEEPIQNQRQTPANARPRRSGDMGRRSGDRERYDADPQVLSDDFSALDSPTSPPRPGQSSFKHSASPSPDRRRVSFQDGPPTEIDNLYDSSTPSKRLSSTGSKASKWQPLSSVAPSPVAENDPFSLGDSDDEKETKTKEQTAGSESDQLKHAPVESVSEPVSSSKEQETKGTIKPDESK